jgi:hypothetical protein
VINAHIRELVVLPPDAMFSGEAYQLIDAPERSG